MVTTKPEEAKEPREFTVRDMMKSLYVLLNTVGGKSQTATIPTVKFDDMPKDWMDRLGMREVEGMDCVQVFLKPRKRKRGKVKSNLILPKDRKLIL